MLEIKLHKHDDSLNRTADLFFPANEIDLAEMMNKIDIGITTEKLCVVDEVQCDYGGLQSLVGTRANVDELQYLAKRMDSFDKNEKKTFFAVAEHEKLTEVKDLINLTFNLHCYALIYDFSDVSHIGRKYELSRRMTIPLDEMENTDFLTIGQQLLSGKKRVITSYGVLFHTGNNRELIYNGEQFPEYRWRDDCAAMVVLEYGDDYSDIKNEYLYLPCSEVEIKKALCRLGAESLYPCYTMLDCDVISEDVRRIFTEDYPLSEHIETLNKLMQIYVGFDDHSSDDFHAIIDMVQPKTPKDVVLLAENFYEFTVVPQVKTPIDYGRYMIIDSGHYNYDSNLEQ